ncbi:alpha/beta hydrolase [Sphingomonas sp. QA11]|uniref:alpha/beta hydrolase n=1 Tax=Sphingomonas sp. QA11 TaxID=2950605 RepID=UPI0023495410|nr:alpha/beta hydrolase [Sphingomonas sp. QA11]WCM28637.1 alpha/beta hydrolase [Sphingomonas sp. QA11]
MLADLERTSGNHDRTLLRVLVMRLSNQAAFRGNSIIRIQHRIKNMISFASSSLVPKVSRAARRIAPGVALVFAVPAFSAQPIQQPPGAIGISADDSITPLASPAEPNAIALATGGVAGSTAPESWFRQYGTAFTRNVSVATVTPFLPDPAKATGAAVIVAPGGGGIFLSAEAEGWKVAQALANRGIAAFVLKYRTRPTPAGALEFKAAMDAMFANAGRRDSRLKPDAAAARVSDAMVDASAAFKLIRDHAHEWHVDPQRVGMIGFSAGAMVTMTTFLGMPATKPAFIGPIYGSMEPVTVPADAPPMFAVLAADDPLFARKGLGLIDSWQQAGRPVEFHLYEHGGHGFGLGKKGTTTTGWFDAFVLWLDTNGFLAPRR